MKSKWTGVIIAFVGLIILSGGAHAQFLVKRVKCADLVTAPGQRIFWNQSGAPANIVFQVVKDGCRPTGFAGFYFLYNVTSGGVGPGWGLERLGKRTIGLKMTISDTRYATVRFFATGGARVSGYLDYMYSVE